jgi:hypothetical protein
MPTGRIASMLFLFAVWFGYAMTYPLVGAAEAQEIRDIQCNAIRLSWTKNGEFAIANVYNGCPQAAVYVAVCVTLGNGARVPRQTVGPVPYGQTQAINIGAISNLDLSAPVPWVAWSLIASDPCRQ